MTKFSDLVASYVSNPKLKGELVEDILVDGKKIKKGTRSDLLIKKGQNAYHFEANGVGFTVERKEFKII